MIEEGALVKAIVSTRQQIDFLWQFFVSVEITIFALLFIYDSVVENMNFVTKAMAAAGVALFCWINGHAISNAYLLLDAIINQYAVSYGKPSRFDPGFLEHFVKVNYADRPQLVLVTHSLSLAIVVLALFWRRFIQAKPQPG